MKTVFCLPDGAGLGGVGVWARDLAARLEGGTLWLHETIPWNPSRAEITRIARGYAGELPALFVPNWSRGTYAACAALAVREPDRLRTIGFGHSDEDYYYEWLTRYEPILHKFVAVSDRIGRELLRRLPHRRKDIVVRPYPLEVGQPRERAISGRPLRLGYAGRLDVRQKRCHDLLSLARKLEERGIDFHLSLFGEGPDGPGLRRLARPLRSVTFEGRVSSEEMRRRFSELDVFLQTSAFEGCSLALREAMAAGCVPVATRVSGTEEWVEDAVSGVLFEPGAVDRAAIALGELNRNRARLLDMARRARHSVERSETPEGYAAWFRGLVDECWASDPRPWPGDCPLTAGRGRLKVRSFYGRVVRSARTRSLIPLN